MWTPQHDGDGSDRGGEIVGVHKLKWSRTGGDPDSVLEWTARTIGTDEFGTWLYCPAGHTYRRANGEVVVSESAGVQLMTGGAWWVAWWWLRDRWIAADVCTPAEHADGTWTYVDLELDVVRGTSGAVSIVDQDEFDELVTGAPLPPAVTRTARDTAEQVRAAMLGEQEPFRDRGWSWLSQAAG